MAIKGLSYMVAGKYGENQGAVTISEGKVLGKAVSYQINLNSPTANDLYGDNGIAESDNEQFAGGTADIGTTEIEPAVRAWMYGITARTEGTSSDTTTFYDYDDDVAPIDMAVGLIELHQVNNVDKWQPVILWRLTPGIINGSANTKGQSIDWQTPTVSCAIKRAGVGKHRWQTHVQYCDTEAEAKEILNDIFGISTT